MKQHPILSLAVALACIATASLSPAHNASAASPTPPRDAKKVVYSLKSGTVKLDIDDDEKVVPNQLKDFDAVATFINPNIAHWSYGFVLRRQAGKGTLAFLVHNNGDTVLGRVIDSFQSVKPFINVKNLKKNANDRNEIALYARGDQVMAFINKVYVDTWTVPDFLEAGELALIADSSDQGTNREIKFTNFIVRTPPNIAPGAAVATLAGDKISKGNIEVTLTK